jgi:hypothetical protein
MTMSRGFRRLVGRLLIGVMVLAQMAIAAFACPTLLSTPQSDAPVAMGASPDTTASTEDGGVAGCDQMDNSAPNLCAEHCHFGQQSADQSPAPTVAAAILTALYTLPAQPEPQGHVQFRADMDIEQAAASPPHAILHCCFRI